MYEFLWNAMSKGGMEIWHSIVRVHSIVRDWSPPGERHVIPYYDITLWRSVSWTTFVFTLGNMRNQWIGGQHLGMLLM